MGASTRLSTREITVEPGSRQSCEIQVRNTGQIVDQFVIDIVGDARGWTVAEPDVLNIYPGEEATAQVTFEPPRTPSTRAGDVPFAIRVISREDSQGSAVEEGVVAVGAFADLVVEIAPRTSRGRRRGRHQLSVENRGNLPLPLDALGADADQHLRFRFSPESFTVEPGTATFVRLRARPVKLFWRGPNKTLPFQAFVTGAVSPPKSVDATMLQEQLLPRWLLPAIALLIAGIAALLGLWFTVVRPAVKSAATDQVTKQTQASTKTAQAAKRAANQAQANSQKALTASGANGGANASGAAGSPSSSPTGGRIQLNVAPGKSGEQSLGGIPKAKTFQLTDVILENPNGDLGTIFLKRGSGILFELNLADFRDLDYHFVSPITVPKGVPLTYSVTCANTTKQACTPAVYLGGYLQ
ncbi:MAG TPA: hypothetical protein VHV76_05115 [Mycobacteriales bacterium]|nr:hypothetical protein [Mycobacteriales bacterium]